MNMERKTGGAPYLFKRNTWIILIQLYLITGVYESPGRSDGSLRSYRIRDFTYSLALLDYITR